MIEMRVSGGIDGRSVMDKGFTKKFFVSVALTVVFCFFVVSGATASFDTRLFHVINDVKQPYLDYLMSVFSFLGYYGWTLLVYVLLVCTVYGLVKKSPCYEKMVYTCIALFSLLVFEKIFVNLLKAYFGRPRPLYALGAENVVFRYPQTDLGDQSLKSLIVSLFKALNWPVTFIAESIAHRSPASFPSGHATRTSAASVFLWRTFPSKQSRPLPVKRWKASLMRSMLMVVSSIVCISRVYIGVHFPSDVVVGVLIGYIFGMTFATFQRYMELRNPLKFKRT